MPEQSMKQGMVIPGTDHYHPTLGGVVILGTDHYHPTLGGVVIPGTDHPLSVYHPTLGAASHHLPPALYGQLFVIMEPENIPVLLAYERLRYT